MGFNKMMRFTLSAAVIAALLVGCQNSDKQKTAIRRTNNGNQENAAAKAAGALTSQSVGGQSQEAEPQALENVFTEFTQSKQNKEVLIESLEDGEYVLTRFLYDANDTKNGNRVSLLAHIDGETICDKTTTASSTKAQVNNNENRNETNGNKVRARGQENKEQVQTATTAVVCDSSKIKIESNLNAKNLNALNVQGVLSIVSYLRFTVKDKKIIINSKSAATIRAGYNQQQRGSALEVQPGETGKRNVFALLTNPNEVIVRGNMYVLKDQKTETGNIVLRQLDKENINITFESGQAGEKASGRVNHFSLQYKKVAKAAGEDKETKQQVNAKETPQVSVNGSGDEIKKDDKKIDAVETKDPVVKATDK